MRHQLNCMISRLQKFTSKIASVKFDSAIRPCAKICLHIITTYFSKTENDFKKLFTNQQKDRIFKVYFDWLFTPPKLRL